MANEISISQTLRYAKSGVAASHASSFQVDQSGDKYQAGVQIVGTSEESLDKGDIGTIGFIDPADGANRIRPLRLTGGEIVVDYRQNGTFSARIVSAESESPIPEPATVVLLVVAVMGLVVTGRFRTQRA